MILVDFRNPGPLGQVRENRLRHNVAAIQLQKTAIGDPKGQVPVPEVFGIPVGHRIWQGHKDRPIKVSRSFFGTVKSVGSGPVDHALWAYSKAGPSGVGSLLQPEEKIKCL